MIGVVPTSYAAMAHIKATELFANTIGVICEVPAVKRTDWIVTRAGTSSKNLVSSITKLCMHHRAEENFPGTRGQINVVGGANTRNDGGNSTWSARRPRRLNETVVLMQPVVSATAQEETSQYEIQYRNSSFGCLFNLWFNRYYELQPHGPGRPNLGLRDGFTAPVERYPYRPVGHRACFKQLVSLFQTKSCSGFKAASDVRQLPNVIAVPSTRYDRQIEGCARHAPRHFDGRARNGYGVKHEPNPWTSDAVVREGTFEFACTTADPVIEQVVRYKPIEQHASAAVVRRADVQDRERAWVVVAVLERDGNKQPKLKGDGERTKNYPRVPLDVFPYAVFITWASTRTCAVGSFAGDGVFRTRPLFGCPRTRISSPLRRKKKTLLCDYMHSTMLDPSMCRGREPDGDQCCCLHCTETTVVDDCTVCKSCGHIETAHPVERPKPGAVIRGLRDAGKLLSNLGSVKTSRQEAQAEMSAGLKKKRKSDTDTEPPQPGKKMKGKEREKLCFSPLFFSCLKHNPEDNKPSKPKPETTEGEDFAFGKWVLLPCGLRDGELQKTKLPPTQEMEAMQRGGLRRFPEVIRYLERKLPEGIERIPSQLWFGVIKIKQSSTVTLAGDDLPNGASLADHCQAGSASSKKHADRVLYIAELPSVAKIKIPKERYSSWDAPGTEAESEELEKFVIRRSADPISGKTLSFKKFGR
ncbi:hypothetical protein DFH08DRAFT_817285 [Mycena albidolilacea]|uniref:Uncharacterized protein n=1 Tax=Mycena albidolilacea TaxID=1033008 RepID=A0AAD6ZIH4_9AGAR|nr:hypothetical protein DFH08DRAFT_817285 [Mycena albidolilacea]